MGNKDSRRNFIKKSALGLSALSTKIYFAQFLPAGYIPLAYSQEIEKEYVKGKAELRILNPRPLNIEALPHLLDDFVTPESRLFVRNNGLISETVKNMFETKDTSQWALTIDGEVNKKLKLSLNDLKTKFKIYTYQLVLECGGNGRAAFSPPAKGNQWTYGAIGCPKWTGVRLKDVLKFAGLKKSAVYTAYYGMDVHPGLEEDKVVISRGTPIKKALEDTSLIAFEMNGKPLPLLHGFPARLVIPGYPASASGKWLKKITITDKVHDGPKMTGQSYRVPKHPVKPGTPVDDKEMKIIEEMPVKSLITFPKSGGTTKNPNNFLVRGHAWTGTGKITEVHLSIDFGQSWIKTKLEGPVNPFAWQRWQANINLPGKGYFEIWARAKDSTGKMQPMVVPGWNPRGYLNNAMPRISVTVV